MVNKLITNMKIFNNPYLNVIQMHFVFIFIFKVLLLKYLRNNFRIMTMKMVHFVFDHERYNSYKKSMPTQPWKWIPQLCDTFDTKRDTCSDQWIKFYMNQSNQINFGPKQKAVQVVLCNGTPVNHEVSKKNCCLIKMKDSSDTKSVLGFCVTLVDDTKNGDYYTVIINNMGFVKMRGSHWESKLCAVTEEEYFSRVNQPAIQIKNNNVDDEEEDDKDNLDNSCDSETTREFKPLALCSFMIQIPINLLKK